MAKDERLAVALEVLRFAEYTIKSEAGAKLYYSEAVEYIREYLKNGKKAS